MPLETFPFDAADYLTDRESIAAYLTEVLAEDDPQEFMEALRDVARAQGGVANLASAIGYSEEALGELLKSPTLELPALIAILRGLRVKLAVTTVSESTTPLAA